MEFTVTRIFNVPVLVGGIVTVQVPIRDPVQVHHAGIVSDRIGDDGQPMIIHNSHAYKRVLETTATDYCKRQTGPLRFWGYPSKVPSDEVLRRARAQVGRKWKLVEYNCEHFATARARARSDVAAAPRRRHVSRDRDGVLRRPRRRRDVADPSRDGPSTPLERPVVSVVAPRSIGQRAATSRGDRGALTSPVNSRRRPDRASLPRFRSTHRTHDRRRSST